jgi:hypothetical protein
MTCSNINMATWHNLLEKAGAHSHLILHQNAEQCILLNGPSQAFVDLTSRRLGLHGCLLCGIMEIILGLRNSIGFRNLCVRLGQQSRVEKKE